MEAPPCPFTSTPTPSSATHSITPRRHLELPRRSRSTSLFWCHRSASLPASSSFQNARQGPDISSAFLPWHSLSFHSPSLSRDAPPLASRTMFPLPPHPEPTPSRSPLPARPPASPTPPRSHSPSRHEAPKTGLLRWSAA